MANGRIFRAGLTQVTAAFGRVYRAGLTGSAVAAPYGRIYRAGMSGDAAVAVRPLTNLTDVEPESVVTFTAELENLASSGALSVLNARFAQASTTAVPVVFAGSSTTQGTGASTTANRFVNRMVTALQVAHPNGTTESTTQAQTDANFTTITTTRGIHGYNLGHGGTTAANFFTADERTRVGALNPAVVFITVGSNDYAFNVNPSTYKTNLQTVIADLRAKAPNVIVVLVHSYQRMDVTGTYAWSLYRQVLFELAAASPADTIFLDLNPDFVAAGVPGADPSNLVGVDNIHPTDAGHQMIADLTLAEITTVPAAVPDSWVWRQISGPTVSFIGSGGTVLFRAPSILTGGQGPTAATVVIGVRAVLDGVSSAERTATIAVLPQTEGWYDTATATWKGRPATVWV